MIKDDKDTYEALEATPEDLLVVHTEKYLDSLRVSFFIISISYRIQDQMPSTYKQCADKLMRSLCGTFRVINLLAV